MASSIMITAEPNGDTLHRLQLGLKECMSAHKTPWVILDFSSIMNIRDMTFDAGKIKIIGREHQPTVDKAPSPAIELSSPPVEFKVPKISVLRFEP